MYFYDTKEGLESVRKKAICNRCFSDEIMLIDNKYICVHCGAEFKEE